MFDAECYLRKVVVYLIVVIYNNGGIKGAYVRMEHIRSKPPICDLLLEIKISFHADKGNW